MSESSPPAYRVDDFFALRTPLLPFTEYLEWSSDLLAPQAAAAGESLDSAIRADLEKLRAKLRALIQRPEIREALYVASSTLDKSLEHWLESPDSERGLAAELVLVRYFQRMAHRCTPFGLFAGHAVGRFDANTRLALDPIGANWRHTRLDRGLTSKLVCHLEQVRSLRESSTVYPNTSLYRTADRLRYVEFTVDENGQRNYRLVAVTEDPFLLEALGRAKDGATIAQLAAAIAPAAGVDMDEAADYVHELIDAQILILDLELPITGPDAIDSLAERLQGLPETREISGIVQAAVSGMREMDAAGVGHAPARYEAIAEQLARLPVSPGRTPSWQVDLFKPASKFVLGPEVARSIQECATLLERIAPAPTVDPLATFREAFQRRYEDRWVPLMEALDPETGIGFPVGAGAAAEDLALLAGFVANSGEAPEPTWNSREIFLARKLEQLRARGVREWQLDEADLQALDSKASPAVFSDSCDLIVRIVASSEEDVERGNFRLFAQSCSASPGGRTLARFCYGDASLEERTRQHLRKEEALRPDVLFAEVVHLPQGRAGNVIARPVLREHEIVFLGRSGAAPEKQIGVSDLSIRLVGDRFVLYSNQHGREVVPRLTNALNYTMTNGVCHFLAVLGSQHTRFFPGWGWGKLVDEPFLPRITCNRVILSRATWKVKAAALKPLLGASGAERFRKAQALRNARALPRFCLLVDGDNELLVDFDNVLSVETFCHLVKHLAVVQIEECLPGPDQLAVQGPEGPFTHEIVVPLVKERTQSPSIPVPAQPPRNDARVAENLAPGSEWMYFKLYGGQGTADAVLTDALAPVLAGLRERGIIDNWFFIRYGDPDTHLRVRLHGNRARLSAEALTHVHAALGPMIESRQLWRIELATYERETHRYGGAQNIHLAERLFGFDSEAAVAIIAACQGDRGADFRWQLALAGVDRWLRDFGLDADARRRFARDARDGYVKEFEAQDKGTQKWFADRFRAERKAIELLIADGYEPEEPALVAGLRALERRSLQVAPLLREVQGLHERKSLTVSLEQLAHSIVHMFVNRVMRSAQRQQEMVIYEFLARLYDSEWGRRRDAARRSAHG